MHCDLSDSISGYSWDLHDLMRQSYFSLSSCYKFYQPRRRFALLSSGPHTLIFQIVLLRQIECSKHHTTQIVLYVRSFDLDLLIPWGLRTNEFDPCAHNLTRLTFSSQSRCWIHQTGLFVGNTLPFTELCDLVSMLLTFRIGRH